MLSETESAGTGYYTTTRRRQRYLIFLKHGHVRFLTICCKQLQYTSHSLVDELNNKKTTFNPVLV